MSDGELCLLQHEVDAIEKLTDTMLDNEVCKAMIRDSNTEYETPGIKEIEGEMWKGCLLYTSPSPRDRTRSRMPSSA